MWLGRCGVVVWLLLLPGPAEAREPATATGWHSMTRGLREARYLGEVQLRWRPWGDHAR